MNSKQQGVQDVITIAIILAIVGFSIQGKLSTLVSVTTFDWIMLVLTVIFLLAYFSDVLFFGVVPTIPTVPTLPLVSQNLPAGTTLTSTTTLPDNTSTTSTETTLTSPDNTSTTSTDSTLQPPVL